MKIYQLGKGVYNTYCRAVKGNDNISYEQAQRKLTRNIILAFRTTDEKNDTQIYLYGNLYIMTKGNKIVHIHNCKGKRDWFFKDMKKYKELNKILKIKVV